MKPLKLKFIGVFFVLFTSLFALHPTKAQAESMCTESKYGVKVLEGIGGTITTEVTEHTIKLDLSGLDYGTYYLKVFEHGALSTTINPFEWGGLETTTGITTSPGNTLATFTLTGNALYSSAWTGSVDTRHVYLLKEGKFTSVCKVGTFDSEVPSTFDEFTCNNLSIYQTRSIQEEGEATPTEIKCYSSGCLDTKSLVYIEGGQFKKRLKNEEIANPESEVFISYGFFNPNAYRFSLDASGNIPPKTPLLNNPFSEAGEHSLYAESVGLLRLNYKGSCSASFTIRQQCSPTECSSKPTGSSTIESTPFLLCDQITDKDLRGKCETCAGDLQDAAGIWTAVGCIKREPTALISSLIQIGLSVAGGVTLLVILSAGFMLTTSQGDPKKAGEAKEMITAAVIGILFIIFSVTILQFIGYNILKIPGFGG